MQVYISKILKHVACKIVYGPLLINEDQDTPSTLELLLLVYISVFYQLNSIDTMGKRKREMSLFHLTVQSMKHRPVPTVLKTRTQPATHPYPHPHNYNYQSGCCLITTPADRQKDEAEVLIQATKTQVTEKILEADMN